MLQFNVDEATSDSCQVCCCEQVTLKAGVTSQLIINYATWAVPIGRLHCDPEFAIEQMAACGVVPGAPVKIDGAVIAYNVPSPPLRGSKLIMGSLELDAWCLSPFRFMNPNTVCLKFRKTESSNTHQPPVLTGPGTLILYPSATSGIHARSSKFGVLVGVRLRVQLMYASGTPHVTIEGYTVNYPHYFVKRLQFELLRSLGKCRRNGVWWLGMDGSLIGC